MTFSPTPAAGVNVTAVCRRSWNRTGGMPCDSHSLPRGARNPPPDLEGHTRLDII